MNVAYLSLGGNLGLREEYLSKARELIRARAGSITNLSTIYESVSWGTHSENKYLNQVVELNTNLSASELLKELLSIEKKIGRVRKGQQYEDRVIDIDILLFNYEIIHTKNLQVPHPRLHLRNFVLVPLSEMIPKYVHPVLKNSIVSLIKNSEDKTKVSKHSGDKYRYICIEGNIGSGKSTLAAKLAKKWNAMLIREEFEKNNLLSFFYKRTADFAFPLEFSLLINRYEQLVTLFKDPVKTVIVADYSIYKSLWFAKITLPQNEFQLFKKYFKTLKAEIPEPDLVIYIDTSIENMKGNIKKRGREYEKDVSTEYLQAVDKQYRKGIAKLACKKIFIKVPEYYTGLESSLVTLIEKNMKEIFGQKS
jgi:deoxyguanosine kinase